MHMMINKNMIMFWASSLSMGGSISTPRPSTQPKQYHELKQYKKIKLWYRTKHLKSLQTIREENTGRSVIRGYSLVVESTVA